MKKILMYVDSMNPSGGIERVVSNLANVFVEEYEVFLLTKDNLPSFYPLDKRVQRSSLGLKKLSIRSSRIGRLLSFVSRMLKSRRNLRTFLKEKPVDYIYTATVLTSLEIVTLGKQYQRKLVISEHGSFFGYNKVYTWLKKFVYPKTYALSVPTKLDTETYLSLGYPAHYIPHLSTFKTNVRSSLNNKVVLNVGRLTSDKNQLHLLDIWRELKEAGELNAWKLCIVGSGEEEQMLRQYIADYALSDCVELMQAITDISKAYLESSLFALTSKNEGFGMVLLEAMSFGVPCISYDCPSGPRDMIINEVNGFLIENRNKEEYLNQLRRILFMNREELCQFGERAFEFASEWDNNAIQSEWKKLFIMEGSV